MRNGEWTSGRKILLLLLCMQIAGLVWLAVPGEQEGGRLTAVSASRLPPTEAKLQHPSLGDVPQTLTWGGWLDRFQRLGEDLSLNMDWRVKESSKYSNNAWLESQIIWRFAQEGSWFVYWRRLLEETSEGAGWRVKRCIFRPWREGGLEADCQLLLKVKEA